MAFHLKMKTEKQGITAPICIVNSGPITIYTSLTQRYKALHIEIEAVAL